MCSRVFSNPPPKNKILTPITKTLLQNQDLQIQNCSNCCKHMIFHFALAPAVNSWIFCGMIQKPKESVMGTLSQFLENWYVTCISLMSSPVKLLQEILCVRRRSFDGWNLPVDRDAPYTSTTTSTTPTTTTSTL